MNHPASVITLRVGERARVRNYPISGWEKGKVKQNPPLKKLNIFVSYVTPSPRRRPVPHRAGHVPGDAAVNTLRRRGAGDGNGAVRQMGSRTELINFVRTKLYIVHMGTKITLILANMQINGIPSQPIFPMPYPILPPPIPCHFRSFHLCYSSFCNFSSRLVL